MSVLTGHRGQTRFSLRMVLETRVELSGFLRAAGESVAATQKRPQKPKRFVSAREHLPPRFERYRFALDKGRQMSESVARHERGTKPLPRKEVATTRHIMRGNPQSNQQRGDLPIFPKRTTLE